MCIYICIYIYIYIYIRGADKSLARHTSRCILFDGENISFGGSLVIYIYIYRERERERERGQYYSSNYDYK